ncbi:ligase-associated DNA damage response DEXH box helicase [Noviherbaspirillum pedocola]|uniref:Ligase-associated DNA damage response DEXH box helicase n=1 Tax=Noviherbaspirillum pedocola TaxID=2801341 RepID=A0A934SZS8_9BURK|nr:ligase-associated DNA damage response DEXH box helicase [Noviherbaspirillum pedocola]MBK4735749.1 ligase-associated DNA damage response DEXH box helicase [Noviherbaspirillum pedocola]
MSAVQEAPESRVDAWFDARGMAPFPFQREVWQAFADGKSGLLHAPTGAGKTYALWLGALLRGMRGQSAPGAGLRVLWITPMRALAADTLRALQAPARDLLPAWNGALRSGDTGSAERARQSKSLPQFLVTTPESLSLLLSMADAAERFARLDAVIVDEWHELLGSKRGVQTQLALARLLTWRPQLLVWGLSATIGNLQQAQAWLPGAADGVLIESRSERRIAIDTLIPDEPGRFPWSGQLGLRMLPQVAAEIDASRSTLVFTNTRAQSELWYQALLEARPDWAGLIALHHGSLDRSVRDWVEAGIGDGSLKAVVCTSSLDLGVDFAPVERVLQIGSAKGVARLLQRAGRSGHAPGRSSRVTLVPTNSLELLEAAAAREAVAERAIEPRLPPNKPLDVLVQHLATAALGGGFLPDAMFEEVRRAPAYRDLSRIEWQWALDFLNRGGASLTAYPEYRRVAPDEHGVWRMSDATLARRHRMNIGTIVSEAGVRVQFLQGGAIGTVDESFVARLSPGDRFLFGGRLLEFVRLHDMTAWVRRAQNGRGAAPRWQGIRTPLSPQLGAAMLEQLAEFAAGRADAADAPELAAIAPLLRLQQRWSALPQPGELVVETLKSRDGWHLFLYPFAGRSVHLGLASLLAWRIARQRPATFSIAVNDYGIELVSPDDIDYAALLGDPVAGTAGVAALLSPADLEIDLAASLNAGELAQRRFREVARIAGLLFTGYPGQKKSNRQLQASSSLFFEVFKKHDPGNLLLAQARREVLEQELDLPRLAATLAALQDWRLRLCSPARVTPFGFALMVERYRERLSTEKLADRIARMLRGLEGAAAKTRGA